MPAVAASDDSRRGTREDGKANAALLPLTTTDVDFGVTVVGTETTEVARGLAVPAIFGAVDVNAGADAPPAFPLLLLLV